MLAVVERGSSEGNLGVRPSPVRSGDDVPGAGAGDVGKAGGEAVEGIGDMVGERRVGTVGEEIGGGKAGETAGGVEGAVGAVDGGVDGVNGARGMVGGMAVGGVGVGNGEGAPVGCPVHPTAARTMTMARDNSM